MKKSTKIIATVIAVTLVITAMLVAIYAATAGNANITANVSWTAQAGVNLEFWAKATGGDETKEIAKTTITPTTTNTDANIIGDLSCNFTDTTDDGVNNPNAIIFTYYVRNKSLTPLNIKVTKTPAEAEESGTGAENHKPKVTLNSDTEGNNTLTAVSSNAGYDLKAGDIFTYSVTLSLAKGGTGTINADFGLAPNFDAGVTFNFNVGGNPNGIIVTSVDGTSPTTVSSSTLAGQTLGEYLATQQTAEYSTGWFFDEGLTKVVSDDYLSQSLNDSSLMSPIYCKTASIEGLVFTLSSDGNSYLVSGESETSPSGEVVIPNMYDGKPVSGFVKGKATVLSSPFKGNKNITSVVLSNNITEMEIYTFNSCLNISSVTIPDSITIIRGNAFKDCSGLTNILIPNSVIIIGSRAFYHCSSLIGIEMPNSVTSIGGSAFQGCSSLTSMEIPNSVTSIEYNTFYCCSSLISISIPNSITNIGTMAFQNCSNLTSIEMPNSVTSIGGSAFQGCSSLTSIEIPNSVTSIGDCAFKNSGLTSIKIPNSVTSIESGMFVECFDLKSVSIGKNTTELSTDFVRGCSSLVSIMVESGNPKYDSRNNCNAIIETETNELVIGCRTSVILNSVTSIGRSAFYECTELINIKLPNSVTSIGAYAFCGCSGMSNITIPDSVISIGAYAFQNCSGLIDTLIIPNSVTTIGYYAFDGCSGLIGDLIIPNSVTTIGHYAFQNCYGLTRIIIGNELTRIDNGTFKNCTSLISVEIPDNVTSIGQYAFNGCSSLTKIFIPKSVTKISTQLFINCSSALQIYCEASSKPDGWDNMWNTTLSVTWGVTRAEFDAL